MQPRVLHMLSNYSRQNLPCQVGFTMTVAAETKHWMRFPISRRYLFRIFFHMFTYPLTLGHRLFARIPLITKVAHLLFYNFLYQLTQFLKTGDILVDFRQSENLSLVIASFIESFTFWWDIPTWSIITWYIFNYICYSSSTYLFG